MAIKHYFWKTDETPYVQDTGTANEKHQAEIEAELAKGEIKYADKDIDGKAVVVDKASATTREIKILTTSIDLSPIYKDVLGDAIKQEINMADVEITVVIPEAWVDDTVEAFTKVAGSRIDMHAHKSTEASEFNANWDFTIAPKGETEGAKAFGARFFKELGLAVVRMYQYAKDRDRYRTEVSEITSAHQDVPDDAINAS